MNNIHISKATELTEIDFEVNIDRDRNMNPAAIQARIDQAFADFSDRVERKKGVRPTKGKVCVLVEHSVKTQGLSGKCRIATFDEVLYFARSQIPEQDYQYGRTSIGFPLASWCVLVSKDNKLLFLRKRGVEGAYSGSPYSAFGSLVSAEHDSQNGLIMPTQFLERAITKEAGYKIWERRNKIRYLGLSSFERNSGKVNNGYDTAWEVSLDATMEEILSILKLNEQFEAKSEARPILAEPRNLGDYLIQERTTPSGLSGVLTYIGSIYGRDELESQVRRYRQEREESLIPSIYHVE